ncbi:hypothetical protein BOTBODRAFT_386745 [Botryobasidium botryosum FD-172 SS1]|uniref:3'-phosphate/5'-hydroxy nucleic acid ligase n=1 Tax=Botryobasidium botryosum (strain FD-172 SS1) TaxID=930990 RepID=A0A067MZF9_BOTB1|nr:hypothetical protein BOTBODRAFT_386745 [Botryobasidium botryosum FD-172 SS1]
MPSRALTIILNANQSTKTVVLVPTSSTNLSTKDWILKEARNKFRVRALSRVHLYGGSEFGPDKALDDNTREVWVSKGEPYCGPVLESHAESSTQAQRAEVRVLAEKSFIDDKAIAQLKMVSELPGVRLAVGMPDLHPGNRFPIGCAIVADGVWPALIGSDIGCGIALYNLSAIPTRLSPQKLASHLKGLDSPWEGDVHAWLARYGIERKSEFDLPALGTVGAGNHFAEICRIESIRDAASCASLGLEENKLYLLVHTGSRGLGAQILETQTKGASNPHITSDSPLLESYLAEHDYAVRWAVANRDLVAHRIKQCLFPGAENSSEIAPDLGKILDITHNSVVKSKMEVEGVARDVWIHRKGAAPSDVGIVPCPGSRGDFSWLLIPTGDGVNNAHSLAHGAGRLHPRAAMHSKQPLKASSKTSLLTTSLGSEVVCTDPTLQLEEQPDAYKSCQGVVDDMEHCGIARGVAVLRPVVTYKIREAGIKR